jgi:hypothetical protein
MGRDVPVFLGIWKEDPEKFLRQFKRAVMANGDIDEKAWLELLPIHLDDAAAWWYESPSAATKASWRELTKALITEYQAKESYQALLAALSMVRQGL